MSPQTKTICLLVLDGWGLAPPSAGNAISQANTVNFNRLTASFPHSQLLAAGEAVGLPRGEAGNTETGHLNLGAGRIVYQDLERINMAIADSTIYRNQALLAAVNHAKTNRSNLHLLGLLGASGVHSNLDHLFALLHLLAIEKFPHVFLHFFTDGRDSPQTSSATYLKQVREVITKEGVGQIASIMGRYWAMDRDRRWDRTAKAYFALTKGEGNLVKTPEEAIEMSYSQGITDEFIEPAITSDQSGKPLSLIKDNDSVIFFNFRIDRPRQLTAAFVAKDFSDQSLALDFDPYLEKYAKTNIAARVSGYQKVFPRDGALKNLFFVTMTEYSHSLVNEGVKVAFAPEVVAIPLGRVIAEAGLKQLRVAESEKERFVTYYFNGLREAVFPAEERVIIPSPDVATYDQKPEMSAFEITNTVLESLKPENNYSFILVNFANPDMVGHTGDIGAAVKAINSVDECLGKIADTILAYDATLIVTGDHGNAEEMINPRTNQIDTEHNANPVPFLVIGKEFTGKAQNLTSGILADVAPTVLACLGIPKPGAMSGRNLLENL